ncbi:MAG: hypothetical protein ABJA98_10980 [Acidobacteriota bacterium]
MVTHPILVRGIGLDRQLAARPTLLRMRDTDFPARFFADLGRDPASRLSTAALVGPGPDGVLHLLQPVQRSLQVAMIDLSCDTVGGPRLSPDRIDGAGLVIRRIATDPKSRTNRHDLTPEAWMQNAAGAFGWTRLKKSDEELDPDPARRPALFSGQPALDRLLSAHLMQSALTETISPAFVMPPEVCERLGKTIVFAAVPTASSDVSDQSPVALDYSDGSLRQNIPPLLLEGTHYAPYAGRTVDYRYMSADYCRQHGALDFLAFLNLLQVVAIELNAFDGTPDGQRLVQALNRRSVTLSNDDKWNVGDFLAAANSVLLSGSPTGNGSLDLPIDWEPSSRDDEAAVIAAAQHCLAARGRAVLAPEGRYQDPTRLYKLRLFLRVRGHDRGHEHCPPRTIWSEYSDAFEIAPWYEAAGLIGPPVPLPRPTAAFFKAAKPNVSFVVPDTLMNAIQGSSLGELSKGNGPSGGLNLSWICSFNIPIITICAFFVLNIFLSLLNIVFFWLPFVKICIPIPSAAVSKVGGES